MISHVFRPTITAIALLLGALPAFAAESSRPPNFVVVLMDDMGWHDVGFMGNKFIETPNIDRLATQGLVFTQAYASAPNCAPTRACLMSGQYTPRHGIYTVVDPRQPPGSPWHKLMAAESKSELATDVVTIAEALQAGGYETAFFGMWNLGRGRTGPVTPGGQGFKRVVFPENLGFGKDAYFDKDGNYLSDRLTDEVIKFVEQHRERPFFVYLPDHAVHAPFKPKADLLKKYEQKVAASKDRRDDPAYAATIEGVDQNVGRILETLERLKLTDNTVVIFTSDNGGTQQYTPPLRGGKGELYEGGDSRSARRVLAWIEEAWQRMPNARFEHRPISHAVRTGQHQAVQESSSGRREPGPCVSGSSRSLSSAAVLALPLLRRPGDAIECPARRRLQAN